MKKFLFTLGASILSGLAVAQSGSFPIEANVGYLDFNDNVNYENTWYVGASTGFNFTDNAGIRGYYWRSLQEDFKLKEDEMFSNLEVYGAESKVAIPITKYTKPYLLVGGGLMKPFGDYKGKDGISGASDKFFGSAGAGLDLNFVDFMNITGFARAMVMDFEQFDNLGQDDNKVKASWNYGGSINFLIGRNGITSKKKEDTSDKIVMPADKVAQAEAEAEYYKNLAEEREQKAEKRASYTDRVDELKREIDRLETSLEVNAIRLENALPEDAEVKQEALQDMVLDLRKNESFQEMDAELQKRYDDLLIRLDAQEEEIKLLKDGQVVETIEVDKVPTKVEEGKTCKDQSKEACTSKCSDSKKEIPDFDHDGILNDIDKCPNVAGPMENHGCPITQKKTEVVTKVVERTPIREVEQRMNFYAQSVFFDFDKATIKGSSKIHMDEIYELMSQFPGTNFVVEGHTDSVGNNAYNKDLSKRRAQSVVNYLVNKGIPSSNLTAIGYGEEQPIASNSTNSGREKNRRVVIKFK